MVGLSDIPCVGKAVDKISDATVEAVFRGLHYMFCYKDLVKVLDSEIEKVNIQEVRVSRRAVAARADGKDIYDEVLKWQTDVKEFHVNAKEFLEMYKNRPSWRCMGRLPIPNPVSRFRIGRKAVQKAKRVTELTDFGKELLTNEIACLPPSEYEPKTDSAFQNFKSRKDAYGKLWEALVTEDSFVIGIYGMPGVGKTRMMEQIWKEAKEKKIFNMFTRADVGSDKLDVLKIQNQIANHLDCRLESQDNVDNRASQLKNSLMNAGKILVILDDVWREIPLDIIGISFGYGSSSRGCKILLTSRDEDVCLRNNCKHPVKITTVTVDEAWDLFRTTVGTSQIDSLQDESLAKEVCNKCAGLPLLIRAVGKALQCRSYNSWKDALLQLEKGEVENIAGIYTQVHACVKLSIDKLPEDAKSCLFLCSLFPEDDEIHIGTLIQLATGSQLVLGEKFRVCAMVDILRSSSLLLDCQEDHLIKLHDLIRDVARSIAARDPKYAFSLVRCGSWFPDNADYGTRKLLRLDLESDDVHFPGDLLFQDLHNLWLECNNHVQQLSGGFFTMFVNLRFLVLQHVCFSSQQQFSFQSLSKLRSLFLDVCDMTNIDGTDVSFFPENLETLCIWDCSIRLWLDLRNLKYLRKLDIYSDPDNVILMVPNTISSLSSLKELHVPNGFRIWDDATDRSTPILEEISKLTRLTSLQISFKDFQPFQDTNIFGNLSEFNIGVGMSPKDIRNDPTSLTRLINLSGYQLEGLEGLMESAEDITLQYTNVNLSSIWKSNKEAFADLRNLYIENCETMEYLARISQDEIQYSRQPHSSFSKLTVLDIDNCSAMKYLFCESVAKRLRQLQQLYVSNCHVMEAIVMNEATSDGDIINFSKLKSLKLIMMPRLRSFYREKKDNSAILSLQFQPLFDGMVAFPSLEELCISYLEDISDIWGKHYCDDNVSSFCQLKSLKVSTCDKLETVFPLAMLHRLRNLEYLSLRSCSALISEISTYDSDTEVCPLVALRDMNLVKLPCLTKTGLNSRDHFGETTLYPNLEALWISECKSLRNVFLPSIARDLMHLKGMYVFDCEMMREIIGASEQEITYGIVFPELTVLRLSYLPNLTSFWCYQNEEPNTYKVEFPNLVDFKLRCEGTNLEAIEWLQCKEFPDVNEYIRQYHERGSNFSNSDGESIYNSQEPETESEIVEEEQLQETEENDQP